MKDETLMGWIDLHERAWINDRYDGRPTMSEMAVASVLAFWYPTKATDKRFTATVHHNLRDLNAYLSKLVIECKFSPPKQRLARLFVNGEPKRIRGVRVVLDDVEES